MKAEDIDLHDARLLSIDVDFQEKRVIVSIEYYSSNTEKDRLFGRFIFGDVSIFSSTLDLNGIGDNMSSGNVNYWSPSFDGGATYFYFVDGFMMISAANLKLESL
jgi:hypothetical protein